MVPPPLLSYVTAWKYYDDDYYYYYAARLLLEYRALTMNEKSFFFPLSLFYQAPRPKVVLTAQKGRAAQ